MLLQIRYGNLKLRNVPLHDGRDCRVRHRQSVLCNTKTPVQSLNPNPKFVLLASGKLRSHANIFDHSVTPQGENNRRRGARTSNLTRNFAKSTRETNLVYHEKPSQPRSEPRASEINEEHLSPKLRVSPRPRSSNSNHATLEPRYATCKGTRS